MSPTWSRHLIVGLAFLVLVVEGCNSPKTYPVEGKIIWKGENKAATELVGGSVLFESEEGNGSAVGEIEANGTFRLTTFKKNDGALPGKYTVTLTAKDVDEADDRPRPNRKPILDQKYQECGPDAAQGDRDRSEGQRDQARSGTSQALTSYPGSH